MHLMVVADEEQEVVTIAKTTTRRMMVAEDTRFYWRCRRQHRCRCYSRMRYRGVCMKEDRLLRWNDGNGVSVGNRPRREGDHCWWLPCMVVPSLTGPSLAGRQGNIQMMIRMVVACCCRALVLTGTMRWEEGKEDGTSRVVAGGAPAAVAAAPAESRRVHMGPHFPGEEPHYHIAVMWDGGVVQVSRHPQNDDGCN
jgi:hypothetical protein